MKYKDTDKIKNQIVFISGMVQDIDLDKFLHDIQRADYVEQRSDTAQYKRAVQLRDHIEMCASALRAFKREAKLLQDFLINEVNNGKGNDNL